MITTCILLAGVISGLSQALSLDQVFDQLKTYDEGRNNQPLIVIEQYVGRISNDPAQRKQTAERLAGILAGPQTSAAANLFLCQQLRLIGGDAQVPLFAKMLDDPKTADMARLALQVIPDQSAGQALISALPRLKGEPLVGVINSLGVRRESASVSALTNVCAQGNQDIVNAVTLALGRIGTPEAAEALLRVAIAHRASFPEFLDGCLLSAQRLATTGHKDEAVKTVQRFKMLGASDQPAFVLLALRAVSAQVFPERAAPEVLANLDSGEPLLLRWAANVAGQLPGDTVTAALTYRSSKLTGIAKLLVLGTLAERGDRAALGGLIENAASADKEARTDATRELRRLRHVVRDVQMREQIDAALKDTGASVATLTPPPYGEEVIAQRKKQLAGGLPTGDKLLCYLDAGVEAAAQASGLMLRQVNGSAWQYPGSEQAAPAPRGTVAFDGSQLEFEVAGLDSQKQYALGFAWWDYDANGRVESVQFAGGDPSKRTEALAQTKLPAYVGAKQGPATAQIPIDSSLTTKGKLRVAFKNHAGPNAVVSELWVVETKPGSPTATKSVLSGGGPATVVAKPAVPMDLTPPAEGTKVLLVTGDDYPGHPWQQTAPALKAILEKDSRLEVRIVEVSNALASPKLKGWDVVIIHFMDWEKPGPGPEARENLRQFVAGGKGMMLTHFACGAWDNNEWPEFKNLAGRVWDPKLRGHDPHGTFTVEITDKEHPITKGMEPFETLDELYTCLAGDAPIHLVAKATSKVDKKDYPMAFVLNYGKGRVFHTVLGHDARAYVSPGVGELMRRGCAWAAGLPPSK